ncbi:MAG: hypothetical protein U0234_24280 [Sandaracinus sp.]
MATREKRPAGSELAAEAPYQGNIGASRRESVHVPLPDGRIRSISVYRAVNVGTDPQLGAAAAAGSLHRFEGGEELAIPYVYHDPAARKLCVVVPEALRHLELKERAKLLTAIAEDESVAVPAYARDATSVIGAAGLAAYLARAEIDWNARETALAARESELGSRDAAAQKREETLASREARVRERAEDVTGREDELRLRAEENEAMSRDLAMREQELESRMATLADRERALADRERALADRERAVGAASARKPESAPPAPSPKSVPPPRTEPKASAPVATKPEPRAFASLRDEAPRPIVIIPDEVEDDVEDDVEELDDDIEPIGTQPGRSRAATLTSPTDSAELVDPDEVAEEVEDSLVREDITGVHRTEDEVQATQIATSTNLVPRASARPMPDPLARGAQVAVRIEEPIELSARLVGDDLGELDMRVRLVTDVGAPVIVLTLTDGRPEHERRLALDPRSADDRRVLEILRRRFEARVHLFGPSGTFLRTTAVRADRETNVARMMDRAARLRSEATASPDAAKERSLGQPAPAQVSHPFVSGDESEDTSAASAARALAEVSEWMAPEKLDQALLELSISEAVIDAVVARVTERAVRHGLALPSALADRAVSAGIAPEQASLAAKQIDAFRATVQREDKGGLDEGAIATNWERLLAAAADHEVAIDGETHDLAYRTIRAVRGDTTGAQAIGLADPTKLAEMGAPELAVMLDHPRLRRAAAVALAGRGDAQYAEALCKAVRKMPRAEVVRVVPRITKLGEEAGDAMIDGLSARKTFVRQAFALALGSLKLRRAVVPLLHLLTSEESDVWREVARVLGSFGNAAFRTLQRQLSEVKAGEERYVRTLAHLANNGCEKAIVELTKDSSDATAARLAVQALAMREEVRIEDERVHGKRPLEGADPWISFSRRFFEELEGTAPDNDLVEAD